MDRAAFIDLFNRYAPLVRRRCVRLIGDQEMAEDVTHDVFLALWKRRDVAALDEPLHYLYRSATNACIDRIRAKGRRGTPQPLTEPLAVSPSDAGRLVARDFLDRVFARLPKRSVASVVCVHLDGMTQEEAAAHLEVARKTVQRDLARFDKEAARLAKEEGRP